MKFKRLLALPLLLTVLLNGCDTQKGGKKQEDTDYPIIEVEEGYCFSRGGSYSGFFIEVGIGRKLGTNGEYEFNLTPSVGGEFTVEISVPQLASIEMFGNYFTLTTHQYTGDFIMKIKNSADLLIYRNVIRVRKAYSYSEVPQALYDVDKYTTTFDSTVQYVYGTWNLIFTSANPISGTLAGGDDMEQNVNITFDMTYIGTDETTDCYEYQMTTKTTTASSTEVVGMLVTRCLDMIYVYEDSGLLAMLGLKQEDHEYEKKRINDCGIIRRTRLNRM